MRPLAILILIFGLITLLTACGDIETAASSLKKVADIFEVSARDANFQADGLRTELRKVRENVTGTGMENILYETEVVATEITANTVAIADCSVQNLKDEFKRSLKEAAALIRARSKELEKLNTNERVHAAIDALAGEIMVPARICLFNPQELDLEPTGKIRGKGLISVRGIGLPLSSDVADRGDKQVDLKFELVASVAVADEKGVLRQLPSGIVSFQTRYLFLIDLSRIEFRSNDRKLIVSLHRKDGTGTRSHSLPIIDRNPDIKEDFVRPQVLSVIPTVGPGEVIHSPFDPSSATEQFYDRPFREAFAGRFVFNGLRPPLKGGDLDFDGGGPLVLVEGEIKFDQTSITQQAQIWALEWDDAANRPRRDLTYVLGHSPVRKVDFTVPPGYVIDQVQPSGKSRLVYYDKDHGEDTKTPGGGPVKVFHCVGDTPGPDVGSTKVTVEWNELKVIMKRAAK